MRKQFWFSKDQDKLLTALTKDLTDTGEIETRHDAAGVPSESAALRWLIEQEAQRRGIKVSAANGRTP